MLATKEKNEIKRIVPMYDDPLLKTGSINYTELYIRAFKKVQENGLKEDKEKEHQRAETKGVVVLYARVNDRVIVLNDPVNFIDPDGLRGNGLTFTDNFINNVTITNDVIIGSPVRSGIGLLTGGAVARTAGTVSGGMALKNLIKYGSIRGLGMTSGATVASVIANSAINAGFVAGALEAGIITGFALNSLYQTFFQGDDDPCSK